MSPPAGGFATVHTVHAYAHIGLLRIYGLAVPCNHPELWWDVAELSAQSKCPQQERVILSRCFLDADHFYLRAQNY